MIIQQLRERVHRIRTYLLIAILSLAGSVRAQQDTTEATNSFFDDSLVKEYSPGRIFIAGEVAQPGFVDLTSLPLSNVVVKELAFENGETRFKGAFLYTGYSLFDILSNFTATKANEKDFRPKVDMYVIVENEKGDKGVFSWGEIYYSSDYLKIILAKQVRAINPSKTKGQWQAPDEPRLICANDQYNVRFISNPTRITVRSAPGVFAAEKPKVMFSPEIRIQFDGTPVTVTDIQTMAEKRSYSNVGYGHGMGFKGVTNVEGFLLKDILRKTLNLHASASGNILAVVSAKDGYRCAFSLSEIINRNDNSELLLQERMDSQRDGRYTLFASPDFFVDRNVRAVETIELIQIK
jgi:hypothetical protein